MATLKELNVSQRWERIEFRLYRDNVYLLSPVSQDLEEQCDALRGRLAELSAIWRPPPHDGRRWRDEKLCVVALSELSITERAMETTPDVRPFSAGLHRLH
ncbi:hypothetical protein [Streptomyces sp. NPDC050738]|uniref:hypothetical protein n=1 Tax=Streptomyces sp. NPDC050738 TaxID=3154744 RepID=UPI00344570DB